MMINSTNSDVDTVMYFANPGARFGSCRRPVLSQPKRPRFTHSLCDIGKLTRRLCEFESCRSPRRRASPTDFATLGKSPEDSVSLDLVAALHFTTPSGRASPTVFATSGNSPEDSVSSNLVVAHDAALHPQTLRHRESHQKTL